LCAALKVCVYNTALEIRSRCKLCKYACFLDYSSEVPIR